MRLAPLALVTSVCLFMAGCTSMAEIPPGTSMATVQAQYGKPTLTCPLPDGGFRAVWSQQPFGQYAWGTNVSPNGDVDVVVQLLADPVFRQLEEGVWGPERVTCEFGPPADIAGVGLPSVRKTVWSYRYKQHGVWNMMMNVFFDPKTMIVVDHYPSPDPMYELDRWPFFF
ncbi:MAG: hypothetical protein LRY53_07360 [Burkholderiaceae bacterium]|nr:hypothetical protein [Burkholderiaceae bacterium]MCD8565445.1 hypothetical protein [Burkholderiaceae bacterium]